MYPPKVIVNLQDDSPMRKGQQVALTVQLVERTVQPCTLRWPGLCEFRLRDVVWPKGTGGTLSRVVRRLRLVTQPVFEHYEVLEHR